MKQHKLVKQRFTGASCEPLPVVLIASRSPGRVSNIINESNYLSAPRIAKEFGRHEVSIYRLIKRRRIQPAFSLNGYHYYNRATLAKIAKILRRKNGCNGDEEA
jgi:hypothetical protein